MTKNFSVAPGPSQLHQVGVLKFAPHFVELDMPVTSVTPNSVIESTKTAQTKKPRVVTHDKHGTVFAPDLTGALVPTTDKTPALATEGLHLPTEPHHLPM